jgi:anti-anti-sigma regulatory factor
MAGGFLSCRPQWAGEEAHMDVYPGLRPPAGSITIEHEGADRRVLCLRGDVDTEVATRFKSSQGRERVAVDAIDAGAVTFISSSGLALMLLYVEASLAAGRHPMLRAASRHVAQALRLAGIDSVFQRPEQDRGSDPHAGSTAGGGNGGDHPTGGLVAW